jgi:hypothetical protein
MTTILIASLWLYSAQWNVREISCGSVGEVFPDRCLGGWPYVREVIPTLCIAGYGCKPAILEPVPTELKR